MDWHRRTSFNRDNWRNIRGEGLPRYGLTFFVREGEVAILVIAPCYETIGLPAIAFMLSLSYPVWFSNYQPPYHLAIMCFKKLETFEKKNKQTNKQTNKTKTKKQINNQTRNTDLFGADFFGGALSSSEKIRKHYLISHHIFPLSKQYKWLQRQRKNIFDIMDI